MSREYIYVPKNTPYEIFYKIASGQEVDDPTPALDLVEQYTGKRVIKKKFYNCIVVDEILPFPFYYYYTMPIGNTEMLKKVLKVCPNGALLRLRIDYEKTRYQTIFDNLNIKLIKGKTYRLINSGDSYDFF